MKSALRMTAPIAAFILAAPAAALAQNAIIADDSALRAGPGFNYPRVAYVPENARVYIHGCLRGFSWCDISWRSERGWIDASNLNYAWNNRYVVVENWGPRIGLPLVGFSVEDYWGRHYRNRPWWEQRHTWVERGGNWRGEDRRRGNDWERNGRGDNWRDNQRDERNERRDWQGQRGDRDDQQWRQRGDSAQSRPMQERGGWERDGRNRGQVEPQDRGSMRDRSGEAREQMRGDR